MKKLMISVLILSFSISSVAYATEARFFKDVKSTYWAKDAIGQISAKGIIEGYPDGTFRPEDTLTYGQFIKQAVLTRGGTDPGNATAPANWAKNYYDKALEQKYFTESQIHSSQLSNEIPRQDMALIISSMLGDTKIDDYNSLQLQMNDVTAETKNDYDIVKAYAAGILTGYPDGTFRPQRGVKRSESAVVMQRLMDGSKRQVVKTQQKEEPHEGGSDLSHVIKNYKTFEQNKIDAGYGSLLAEAEKYEYIDPSAYQVEAYERNGTKAIKINGNWPLKLGWGNLYFMSNNQIIKFTQDGIYDDETREKKHIDVTTVEYFVFPRYQNVEHVIGIMPNPLYVKKS